VVVSHGLVKRLANESELAGVLAHEIAHVLKKHQLIAIQSDAGWNAAATGAKAVAADRIGRSGDALGLKSQLASAGVDLVKDGLFLRPLDRSMEYEADRVGVVIAARGGYDPYGLVAKAGVWYLVCGSHAQVRVYQVSDLLDASMTTQASQRPADFDLGAFWRGWCAQQEAGRSAYTVSVRVAPGFVPWLPVYFGEHLRIKDSSTDADGWLRLELSFENLHAARDRLLDCGGGVEVLAPLALRMSIQDYARQIVNRYTGG
jgi:hypothetical protein